MRWRSVMGFMALVIMAVLVWGSMPRMMRGWAYSGSMLETGSSSVIRPRSTHWRAQMVVSSYGSFRR